MNENASDDPVKVIVLIIKKIISFLFGSLLILVTVSYTHLTLPTICSV